MLTKIIKILILVLVITNSTVMLAQERTGPPPPANQTRGGELPIDNNVIILIVLGILYGVYITYKKHQIKDTLQ